MSEKESNEKMLYHEIKIDFVISKRMHGAITRNVGRIGFDNAISMHMAGFIISACPMIELHANTGFHLPPKDIIFSHFNGGKAVDCMLAMLISREAHARIVANAEEKTNGNVTFEDMLGWHLEKIVNLAFDKSLHVEGMMHGSEHILASKITVDFDVVEQ